MLDCLLACLFVGVSQNGGSPFDCSIGSPKETLAVWGDPYLGVSVFAAATLLVRIQKLLERATPNQYGATGRTNFPTTTITTHC